MWLALLAVFPVAWMVLALMHRGYLARLWREPVLRYPVLIIESDDWGWGPSIQAEALDRLREILLRYTDSTGHPPVMTLGIVLAGPARGERRGSPASDYRSETLAATRFDALRGAMGRGCEEGVFALQLHGMEHYWPDCLLRAAAIDPEVARWILDPAAEHTESLPPRLQTRWVDCSSLPSQALPAVEVHDAARTEAAAFRRIFMRAPSVAVPPTFVWTADVERAWAAEGVRFVVTPGTRYEARDTAGRPARPTAPVLNGESGSHGVTYLVRNRYFEPSRGHGARDLVQSISAQTSLGRPTLVETHRWNFVGGPDPQAALLSLADGLKSAVGAFPELRFMSTDTLGESITGDDDRLVEKRLPALLVAWVARVLDQSSLRRAATWSLGIIPLRLLAFIAQLALPAAPTGRLRAGTR